MFCLHFFVHLPFLLSYFASPSRVLVPTIFCDIGVYFFGTRTDKVVGEFWTNLRANKRAPVSKFFTSMEYFTYVRSLPVELIPKTLENVPPSSRYIILLQSKLLRYMRPVAPEFSQLLHRIVKLETRVG